MRNVACIIVLGSLACLTYGREFQFLNNLPGEIWVGCLANHGHPTLGNGGWKLGAYQRMSVHGPDNWGGRFWARTWCNPGSGRCETGDCGGGVECNGRGGEPPASLAEIQLSGHAGLDYYDISLVDGFNVKISMEPLGGQGNGDHYSCGKAKCDFDLNQECPQELRKYGSGGVLACKSSCNAFNTDQYCCRGAYGTPQSCKTWEWQTNSASYFKGKCPDAYSYAYDDRKSTFTCRAPAYLITFG